MKLAHGMVLMAMACLLNGCVSGKPRPGAAATSGPKPQSSVAPGAPSLEAEPSPAPPPAASVVSTNSLGMEFVPVPGTDALFCKWETRVQDFEAFVEALGYDATKDMWSWRPDADGGWKRRGDTWKSPGFDQGPTHPVVGVSWEDAQAFCRWLTRRDRRAGNLEPLRQYRLPTDEEWSRAVGLEGERGATPKDRDGKPRGVYPWGTKWPPPKDAGNYAGEESVAGPNSGWNAIGGYRDGHARTAPVGSYPANRYGLFDMGGNVWEWVEDDYDGTGGGRVWRGASWGNCEPDLLLASRRHGAVSSYRDIYCGMRVVISWTAVAAACRDAVRALTDQAKLAEVAQEHPEPLIRAEAVRNLTDPAVLAKVAKEDKQQFVREIADSRLKELAREEAARKTK